MSRHLEFTRPLAFDTDYWLCRCHGFHVDSPAGRVGLVEEVRFGSRHDRPDELVLRTGMFANRQVVVPVAEVEQIVLRQQRLILRAPPGHKREHERLARPHYLAATLGVR